MDASKFAERLNDLIFEKGLQQNQLAEATGLTETSISQYARGITQPTIKSLVALADYFKCSTDFLLGDTDANSEKKFLQCPEFSVSLKRILADHNCSGYNCARKRKSRKQVFTIGKTATPILRWIIFIKSQLKKLLCDSYKLLLLNKMCS